MTERLYHTDPGLRFEARVQEVRRHEERAAVVLDRTAFYPTGGGQPHDTGVLAGRRVVDVVAEDEGGAVLHVLEGADAPGIGETVTGIVDAQRRREHLQQHTGQHILSQAFERAARRRTESFHMGAELCTIDLDGAVTRDDLLAAEDLANAVVFDDRPVMVHVVEAGELGRFPVRKQTYHGERVRLIEIHDFDVSTCGGTHAPRTGAVGLITVQGVEKVKGRARVSFACGLRALRVLRRHTSVVQEIGSALTTSPERAAEQVRELAQRVKRQDRILREYREAALAQEAADLLARAEEHAGFRLVCRTREGTREEAEVLARKLTEHPRVWAVLAVPAPGEIRVLFARSADAPGHAGTLLKEVLAGLQGRGGGSPVLAQGVVPADVSAENVLARARGRLLAP